MSKNRNQNAKHRRSSAAPPPDKAKPKSKATLIIAVIALAAAVALILSPLIFPSKEGQNTNSELRITDRVVGTGPSPSVGKKVKVHYTGTLENGVKFDSSVDRGQPFQFTIGVGQVIKGWDEGVMTMKVGGKRQLIVPPALGYGSRATGPIPPNSTLYFEVELLGVE